MDSIQQIKSIYILKNILHYLSKKRVLLIIRYNKKIQNRLNLNFNNFKEYSKLYSTIEIELIPIENKYSNIINISKEYEPYYHIYFNDNKEETKKNYIEEKDIIKIINIKIEHQIKSFKGLFSYCKYIKSINFKQFSRSGITDMSEMFRECISLEKIYLSNFNTENVTNMSYMFSWCKALKELNLSNFNTNNVTNMSYMFIGCSSLEKINLSNFNTNNVINMNLMFSKCSALKDINLSNFNFDKTKKMNSFFGYCSSLINLNISNFFSNKNIEMKGMFLGCSQDFISKIKEKYKDIKIECFY